MEQGRYDELEMEGGGLTIYDKENHQAWITLYPRSRTIKVDNRVNGPIKNGEINKQEET